jgi:hypothetical protein
MRFVPAWYLKLGAHLHSDTELKASDEIKPLITGSTQTHY